MSTAAFLLAAQLSTLVAPLHHGDAPPPTRAVAALRIADEGRPGSALASARELLTGLSAPAEFTELARAQSMQRAAARAGLFGIHPPGLLVRRLEAALDELQVGQLAAPIEVEGGVWIVQRIEHSVACRQIFVSGVDQAARSRADRLAQLARGGGDFAVLARDHSDDRASALRGGDLAIFERSAHESGVRAAAFSARVGEIVGPIATPLGFHVVQRVAVDGVDPRLRDDNWARVRVLLVAFGGAAGADPALVREHHEAERIADELAARLRRGEDMAALAREWTDDRGMRELGGDVGWVRRGATRMPALFDRVFVEPPGVLLGPIASNAGFLLLRREDPGLRSRVDLRLDALADMEQWVRALAERTLTGDELIDRVAADARMLGHALESAARPGRSEWGRIEGLLPWSVSAADMSWHCARLDEGAAPGRIGSPSWTELAVKFAAGLEFLEPGFRGPSGPWSERRRSIEERLSGLRTDFGTLGPIALERLMAALGFEPDPRIVLPVYLVADGPRPGAFTHATRAGAASWVAVAPHAGTRLHEAILHQTAHALDLVGSARGGVFAQLRESMRAAGIGPADPAWDAAPSALGLVTANWVVRDVFARAHPAVRELDPARFGRAASAVVGPWCEHLAGKLERRAALEAIVAALAARAK